MNINRHNYEVIFLMYVDNELSAAEKKDVQVFIEQNPDLQKELELLQQAVLNPTSVIFNDKSLLLKNEVSVENLLLLLDNEIDGAEKEKVTGLIASDASIAKEWGLLQQTKLHPNAAIIFDDKSSLYRRASERVLDFNWWKVAVAAVLIGFGIWMGIPFLIKKDNKTGNSTALNNNKPDEKNIVQKAAGENQVINKSILKDTNVIKLQQQNLAQQAIKKDIHKIDKQVKLRENNNYSIDNKVEVKKSINNNSSFSDNDSNKEVASNVPLKKLNDEAVQLQNTASVDIKEKLNNKMMAPDLASNVSLKDNTDEVNSDNHILYISENKLQKTKVGSFFNKVKNTTKARLKKGIRIANMEFAIQ
jgi:hypothetical protein